MPYYAFLHPFDNSCIRNLFLWFTYKHVTLSSMSVTSTTLSIATRHVDLLKEEDLHHLLLIKQTWHLPLWDFFKCIQVVYFSSISPPKNPRRQETVNLLNHILQLCFILPNFKQVWSQEVVIRNTWILRC